MRKRLVALDSEPYRRFAAELVATRERAGITQRELAKRTGWSQSQIAKHELGARRMDVVELEIFCEACGESLEGFVRRLRTDPPPPSKSGPPKRI